MSGDLYQASVTEIDDLRRALAYESRILSSWLTFLTYPVKPRSESETLLIDLARAVRGDGPLAFSDEVRTSNQAALRSFEVRAQIENGRLRRVLSRVGYTAAKHLAYRTFPRSCVQDANEMFARTRLVSLGDVKTAYAGIARSAMNREVRELDGILFHGRVEAWEDSCRA